MEIKYELTKTPKEKPTGALGFGHIFTDHMFVMDYDEGKGWHDARIVPYQPLVLDPSALVFHYAQECFEGLKAYRTPEGKVQLFRPDKNGARLASTHDRLCIPEIPVEDFVEAVRALVKVEQDWVPSEPDTSLYIRPFTIATEPVLGVKASSQYKFIIICSPSGAYYEEGLDPVNIYVEDEYVRATPGGTGYIKCGGNYAASIIASEKAHKLGFAQVLWLDGVERKYVEEGGGMNVMFKINGAVVTPALTGSILRGVTRKSAIELLKSWDVPVEERLLSVDELFEAAKTGALEEAWCIGTAAVISPIGALGWGDKCYEINHNRIGELSQKLYDELTGIQWGTKPDPFGWTCPVC